MKCCICNVQVRDKMSHNASPFDDGRCCGTCNEQYVIPYRIRIGYLEVKNV